MTQKSSTEVCDQVPSAEGPCQTRERSRSSFKELQTATSGRLKKHQHTKAAPPYMSEVTFFSSQFSSISTTCCQFNVQVLWNPSWDRTGNPSLGLRPQSHEHAEGSATRPAPELLPYPCWKSRMCQQVCGPHGELRITPLSLLKITPPPFFWGERAGGPCVCGPTDRGAAAAGGGAGPGARGCWKKCFGHVSRHQEVMLWQSGTHPLCSFLLGAGTLVWPKDGLP